MRQLVHDYAWDPIIHDPVTGTGSNRDSAVVRSSLVVLLSRCCRSFKCLSEFLNVSVDNECLVNVSAFCERFCALFKNVNDAFVSKDIQFTWVDVRYETECSEANFGIDESESSFGFVKCGIKSLGWGFCSTYSLVLGSALVPFGLIYPTIVISSKTFSCDGCSKKLQAQLSLELLDVNQKPLECKCTDLELVHLYLPRNTCQDDCVIAIPEIMNSGSGGTFGDGVKKLQVKALQRWDEVEKFKGHLANPILVREVLGKPGKDEKESSGKHFAYKVLQVLATELGELGPRKPVPIWQILLSFLYREGYCALVSLSNHSGDSHLGILKPFTVFSALLYILDASFNPQKMMHGLEKAKVSQFSTKMGHEISTPTNEKHSDGSSPSTRCPADRDGKRKSKRHKKLLQDLSGAAFCNAAFEHSELQLEELYFARAHNYSKKLKFLKCWMKQIKKSSCYHPILEENSKPHSKMPKEVDDRLAELEQENEQPVSSSASAGENILTGNSRIQDEAAGEFQTENSEAFLDNLSSKILQGLESDRVDLGALAQRLVSSSIYWLNRQCVRENISESQTSVINSKDSSGCFIDELFKLLLIDPKDLAVKHKSNWESDTRPASEKIFREYPFLYVLFFLSCTS